MQTWLLTWGYRVGRAPQCAALVQARTRDEALARVPPSSYRDWDYTEVVPARGTLNTAPMWVQFIDVPQEADEREEERTCSV